MTQHNHSPAQKQAMRKTVITCLGVVFGMVGLAYASVPLYDLFCRVTGFGGTPMVGAADAGTVLEETVRVRFDSNVARALPWDFRAERPVVQTQIGQTETVFYRVANTAEHPVNGMATYNVSPENAGQYFVKLQCFCFEENTLEAGEVMDSAVVFYVDPAIVDDPEFESMRTITLSYTYWPAVGGDPVTTSALETTPPRR
jgi:cytochrome c oxidase assembly protein subunit 11